MTTPSSFSRRGPDWNWTRMRALCLREARRVLGATAGADDAAQEAACRAWRSRGDCRTPGAPEPWVAAIARREALRIAAQRCDLPLEDAGRRRLGDACAEPDRHAVLDLRRALRRMDGQDV